MKQLITIIITLFLISCSGIKTTKELVKDEALAIDQWEMYFIPMTVTSAPRTALVEFGPADSLFKDDYLKRISLELRKKHGVIFYDNFPKPGKLLIDIRTTTHVGFPDTKYDVIDFDKYDKYGVPAVPVKPLVIPDKSAPIGRIKSDMKVKHLRILAYNVKDELIGEIYLSGYSIKPKHVAKAIFEKILKK